MLDFRGLLREDEFYDLVHPGHSGAVKVSARVAAFLLGSAPQLHRVSRLAP